MKNEHIERLIAMIDDDQTKWDFSPKDVAAISFAVTSLTECCKVLLDTDSELSAYGHGRPLDKAEALRISGDARRIYEKLKTIA